MKLSETMKDTLIEALNYARHYGNTIVDVYGYGGVRSTTSSALVRRGLAEYTRDNGDGWPVLTAAGLAEAARLRAERNGDQAEEAPKPVKHFEYGSPEMFRVTCGAPADVPSARTRDLREVTCQLCREDDQAETATTDTPAGTRVRINAGRYAGHTGNSMGPDWSRVLVDDLSVIVAPLPSRPSGRSAVADAATRYRTPADAQRVTREWVHTLDSGRIVTASVRLVPHTNPADVPLLPSARFTVYTATPATFDHLAYSTREHAMRSVERFTETMNARAGWTRTR